MSKQRKQEPSIVHMLGSSQLYPSRKRRRYQKKKLVISILQTHLAFLSLLMGIHDVLCLNRKPGPSLVAHAPPKTSSKYENAYPAVSFNILFQPCSSRGFPRVRGNAKRAWPENEGLEDGEASAKQRKDCGIHLFKFLKRWWRIYVERAGHGLKEL